MQRSILKELNKKNLGIWLFGRTYTEVYFPIFFPAKTTSFLTYETLIGTQGAKIAADIVTYDSTAPIKSRQVIGKLTGEIPPIRIKRVMSEKDINEYNVLSAYAVDANQKALLDLVFGDVDFVYEGVQARMEWIALTALSTGVIALTKANNNGLVTEENIDFQVPDANKTGVAVIWSSPSTATPLTDIRAVLSTARAVGHKLQFMLMRWSDFDAMRKTKEVKDEIAFAVTGQKGITKAPTFDMINEYFKMEGFPIIKIIDQSIGIETDENVVSYVNPWSQYKIAFLPDLRCGDFLTGPLAARTNPPEQEIQSERNGILIAKYRTSDPVTELTRAEINAFPSWGNVDRYYLMNTNNVTTWS